MENVSFTRKQFYDLVWEHSLLALSKKYSISDVGLRKICKTLNIPLPNAGHWNKFKAGKQVYIIKLPDHSGSEARIQLSLRTENSINLDFEVLPLKKRQREIESDSNLTFSVPSELIQPSNLIIIARKTLLSQKPNKYGNSNGLLYCYKGELDIKVSPGNISRALCFMDCFIKLIIARGHQLVLENGTEIIIKQEKLKVDLREKLDRSLAETNIGTRNQINSPSGILALRVRENHYKSKEWKDGKISLEKQLPRIIAWLELKANDMTNESLRIKLYQEGRRKERQIQIDYRLKQENELSDFKKLLENAFRWQRVKILRTYLAEMVNKTVSANQENDEFSKWVLWANGKLDWYDPWIEKHDELLTDVDKETLRFNTEK